MASERQLRQRSWTRCQPTPFENFDVILDRAARLGKNSFFLKPMYTRVNARHCSTAFSGLGVRGTEICKEGKEFAVLQVLLLDMRIVDAASQESVQTIAGSWN